MIIKENKEAINKLNEDYLNETTYEKSFVIDKCRELGKKFIEHFHKIYLENDIDLIKHRSKEMQNCLDKVLTMRLKHNNKCLNEKQIYDWFITCGKIPIDLFETDEEAALYTSFADDLLDENKNVFESITKTMNIYKKNKNLSELDALDLPIMPDYKSL